MRYLLLCLALLVPTPVLTQSPPALDVVVSEVLKVDGANNFINIGDRVYLKYVSRKIRYKNVGLIRVKTEAANVEVIVDDRDRKPVEVERIAPEYYEIDQSGEFWIDVTAIDFAKNIYGRQRKSLVVGKPEPDPDDDDDPDDPDDDDPPTPPPPIDEKGLHILMVYESDQAASLKKGHREIFYGQDARKYFNSVAGSNWRILDKDSVFEGDSKWNRALKRPRTELPWIIISNGVTGFEGPLPNNLNELRGMVDIYIPPKKR